MKNKSMDILQKTEQQLMEELLILKDPNVGKERKTKAKRNIKNYEKYLKDTSNEEINGKKYPPREVPPKITKKELLELIDSVEGIPNSIITVDESFSYGLDLSGVSVGKNRFVFIE